MRAGSLYYLGPGERPHSTGSSTVQTAQNESEKRKRKGPIAMGCLSLSSGGDSSSSAEATRSDTREATKKASKLAEVLEGIVVRGVQHVDVRRKFIQDSDVEQLCVALDKNQRVTGLDLSCNNVSFKGIDCLAGILQPKSRSGLTKLDLSANERIGNLGVFVLSAALSCNPSIVWLDLSGIGFSDSGLGELSNALRYNTRLQTLLLAGSKITDVGVCDLARGLACNNTLKELDLHGHGMHLLSTGRLTELSVSFLAEALSRCSLKSLNLGGNAIDRVDDLMELVDNGCNLERLFLDRNKLDHSCCLQVAEAISSSYCKLLELDLSCNNIGDLGLATLGKGIGRCRLEVLSLKKTQVTSSSMQEFCVALRANKTLRSLNLSGNEIDDKAMIPFGRYLGENESLWSLDLSHNKLSALGAGDLCEGLRFGSNYTLTELKLGFNDINDDFVTKVACMLESNTTLVFLDLRNQANTPDTISMFGASTLVYAMRMNKTLHTLALSRVVRSFGTVRQMPEIQSLLARNLTLRRQRLWRIVRGLFRFIIAFSRFRNEYYNPKSLGAQRAQDDYQFRAKSFLQ